MPKWECGRGRKSPSATSQNDTGQRTRGDGSDDHRAKEEKCDELRRARVIGAADADIAEVCSSVTDSMPPLAYALRAPHDSRHKDATGMNQGDHVYGNETYFPEATGRARGVRWSGDESAPIDWRAASREPGPRCASRAGRWEKWDVISELLSPSPLSLLFSVAGLPLGLNPLPKLFLLIPSPLSLCICHPADNDTDFPRTIRRARGLKV
ncbi:hypothetical protein B0H13DRAFT_2264176 [Mycena leptocephala]|nr:hypothetical protein B0H13DRAFT_2264176 [Mycena leptocephala]